MHKIVSLHYKVNIPAFWIFWPKMEYKAQKIRNRKWLRCYSRSIDTTNMEKIAVFEPNEMGGLKKYKNKISTY